MEIVFNTHTHTHTHKYICLKKLSSWMLKILSKDEIEKSISWLFLMTLTKSSQITTIMQSQKKWIIDSGSFLQKHNLEYPSGCIFKRIKRNSIVKSLKVKWSKMRMPYWLKKPKTVICEKKNNNANFVWQGLGLQCAHPQSCGFFWV